MKKVLRFFSKRYVQAAVLVFISMIAMLIIFNLTNTVTVSADGTSSVVVTVEKDFKKIVERAGYALGEHDRVVETDSKPHQLSLQVDRAMEISVTADGENQSVWMYDGNVGDVLESIGISLGENDLCNLASEELLTDGTNIQVKRVTYKEITKTKSVPYETQVKKSYAVLKGTEKVSREGKDGVRTIVIRQKYVDGVLESEEEISNEITTKPVSEIIIKGLKMSTDKIVKQFATVCEDGTLIDHLGNVVNYSKVITGRATAYTAPAGSGTATGRKAAEGVVAVDKRIIPYGTQLYICSPDGSFVYGYAVAGDTGGTLMAGTVLVDVFYDTLEECYTFGSRKMCVYILS